jgi:uncharacterized membrane protein YoaK (UPF0700 family)
MKVIAFTGSRGWTDVVPIVAVLDELDAQRTVLVVGDARGVDGIVRASAQARGFFVAFVAARHYWRRYGRSAGMRRNAAMLALGVDEVIAFWDGASPGTRGMIVMAMAQSLPVTVHYPDGTIQKEGQ